MPVGEHQKAAAEAVISQREQIRAEIENRQAVETLCKIMRAVSAKLSRVIEQNDENAALVDEQVVELKRIRKALGAKSAAADDPLSPEAFERMRRDLGNGAQPIPHAPAQQVVGAAGPAPAPVPPRAVAPVPPKFSKPNGHHHEP